MIAVAESGSSKTDWRILLPQGEIKQAKTKGINPYYQHTEEIYEVLHSIETQIDTSAIQEVYFYGAGCSTPANNEAVKQALKRIFGDANIEVQHDLLAAARALCGKEEGIACIIGTGSNSCVFDGKEIIHQRPSLGLYLGDEGSGGYMGKKLITSWLYGEMPTDLGEVFRKRYGISQANILENIYQKPNPNVYLASFSHFLLAHIYEPFCYGLVYESFDAFFEKHITQYPMYKEYKLHFTGSIAYYFSNILHSAAQEREMRIHHIAEKPIAGLCLYHQ